MHMCTEGTHQSQANMKGMTLTGRGCVESQKWDFQTFGMTGSCYCCKHEQHEKFEAQNYEPPPLKNSLDKWREHRP